MAGYLQGAYGRGLNFMGGAAVRGIVGGGVSYGLNLLLVSGKIPFLTKLVPGSASWRTAVFAGGAMIALGAFFAEVAVPNQHHSGRKRELIQLVGMFASIPVNIYLFRANPRQAMVFGLTGILVNEIFNHSYDSP